MGRKQRGGTAARAMGSDIISVRQARALGPGPVAERLPKAAALYITIDIDAFCRLLAAETDKRNNEKKKKEDGRITPFDILTNELL